MGQPSHLLTSPAKSAAGRRHVLLTVGIKLACICEQSRRRENRKSLSTLPLAARRVVHRLTTELFGAILAFRTAATTNGDDRSCRMECISRPRGPTSKA